MNVCEFARLPPGKAVGRKIGLRGNAIDNVARSERDDGIAVEEVTPSPSWRGRAQRSQSRISVHNSRRDSMRAAGLSSQDEEHSF